jgi:ligand-binding SRPBCC domain-containing protein
MTLRFRNRQWVPFSVELVFAFLANPSNLPHLLLPGWKARVEDARIVPPPTRPEPADAARRFRSMGAGVGSEIVFSFVPIAWVPNRLSWTARITEFDWNSHFTDEQVRGPFLSFRHQHIIQPESREGFEGTLVGDEIEYALPYGFLGLLLGVLVRRRLAQSFAYRETRLPEILAVAARQAVKRG